MQTIATIVGTRSRLLFLFKVSKCSLNTKEANPPSPKQLCDVGANDRVRVGPVLVEPDDVAAFRNISFTTGVTVQLVHAQERSRI